jgi:hypothetical protein
LISNSGTVNIHYSQTLGESSILLPLESIGNTRKIAAVVAGERYLSGEILRRMLANVEAKAGKN